MKKIATIKKQNDFQFNDLPICNFILGLWIYRRMGLRSTSVFLRSLWTSAIFCFLPPIVFMIVKFGPEVPSIVQMIDSTSIEKFLTGISIFYGVTWAIFLNYRNEFVSKYGKLVDVHDKTFSETSALRDVFLDGKTIYIVEPFALNFLEDSLLFCLHRHDSFRHTFSWIVGALLKNRHCYKEYFDLEMTDLPMTKWYIDHLSDCDIALIDANFSSILTYEKMKRRTQILGDTNNER